MPLALNRRFGDRLSGAKAAWNGQQIGGGYKAPHLHSQGQVKGSRSYVGRNRLEIGMNERTMNFGWGLTGKDAPTSCETVGSGHRDRRVDIGSEPIRAGNQRRCLINLLHGDWPAGIACQVPKKNPEEIASMVPAFAFNTHNEFAMALGRISGRTRSP